MHIYGIITVLPFSKYASPIFAKRSKTENYVSLWIFGKSTVWLRMTILTIIIQLAHCQMQHNTWQWSHCSAFLTAPKLTTACRWRSIGQWNCLHSILLTELLTTKDLHKVLADLCLLFQVSCVSTWTQLSKLINVLSTWTTLASQLIMLWNSPGTLGQSSSAFVQQDWNWQLRKATSESDKLYS